MLWTSTKKKGTKLRKIIQRNQANVIFCTIFILQSEPGLPLVPWITISCHLRIRRIFRSNNAILDVRKQKYVLTCYTHKKIRPLASLYNEFLILISQPSRVRRHFISMPILCDVISYIHWLHAVSKNFVRSFRWPLQGYLISPKAWFNRML